MTTRTVMMFACACLMVAAGGCFELPNERVDLVERVLPTGAALRIQVPEGGGDGVTTKALGQLASTYIDLRDLSGALNGGAGWVLDLVHAVMAIEPTEVTFDDDDTGHYTWGPMSEPDEATEWRLVVTESIGGDVSWALAGRPKDGTSAFRTVIEGSTGEDAGEDAAGGDAGDGGRDDAGPGDAGVFTIDFDALRALEPGNDDAQGALAVRYDLAARDGRRIRLDIAHTQDGGETTTFDYIYEERLDGAARFDFGLKADIDEDGSALENIEIRAQWQPDGQGRGDITMTDGDLGPFTVTATECWNEAFRRVFYADSFGFLAAEGTEAACAFGPAEPL